MDVLLASLLFLERPEEGTSFPGTRVSGTCDVVLLSDPALHLPASTVFAKLIMMMIINCLDVFFLVFPCAVPTSLFSNTQEAEDATHSIPV